LIMVIKDMCHITRVTNLFAWETEDYADPIKEPPKPEDAREYILDFLHIKPKKLPDLSRIHSATPNSVNHDVMYDIRRSMRLAEYYQSIIGQKTDLDIIILGHSTARAKMHQGIRKLNTWNIENNTRDENMINEVKLALKLHRTPSSTTKIPELLNIIDQSTPYQRATLRTLVGEYNTTSKFLAWRADNPPSDDCYIGREPWSNNTGDEARKQRKKYVRDHLVESGWLWTEHEEPASMEGTGKLLTRGHEQQVVHSRGYFPMPQDHQLWKTAAGIAEVFDLDMEAGTFCAVYVVGTYVDEGSVWGPFNLWPEWRSDLIGGPGAPWQHSYGQSQHEISKIPKEKSKLVPTNGGMFYKSTDVKR